MRLTCPNCSAQYEVPDDVIPENGRDVQCSNCEHTWFQAKNQETTDTPEPVQPPPAKPEPEPEQVSPTAQTEADTEDDAIEPETTVASSGNVDPAIAGILKEEAARESKLRAQEGTSLESQPDLALDQPDEPKVKPARPAATATSEDAGQKDALPDVQAINTGLQSDDVSKKSEDVPTEQRKSGGFLRGFALILIIGVILYLVYSNANQIGEAVPQAYPALKSYVSLVDQARLWLETQAGGAVQN
ncbi:zinc-ribbon domain-containing protein [Ruegeria arenilitoris]|uniref:zinc-ribbon domain-containing protein n=1 Tax=Ruegeria arenilitoris TaxID=1173585 RepID=UPI00147EA8DE|nr:zinc-ribbon domain-containing protein [Ruegeria arenilitoris]